MKLSQVSILSGRAQQFLAKMMAQALILQYAEFKLDPSTFLNFKDTDTFTSTAARAEGSAVRKDAQVPTTAQLSLALYGREISIDDVRKLDQNVGGSPAGLKLFADRRLGGLCVKLADEIQTDIVTGSGTANEMLGLSTFVMDAAAAGQTTRLGFTTAELAAMNYNVNLRLNDSDNQKTFVELLMKKIMEVPGANTIICNASVAARLTTIAKTFGAAGENVNSFGTWAPTFNKLPIVALNETAIPQTESDGENADCSSIYVVRFAEELGVAISTNSGFYFQDFPDYQTYPSGVARLQFFLQLAVERTDAMRRLSRIRL